MEVARLIQITSLCKQLNCLPGPGGLLQQDPYLIEGMNFVMLAMHEREELEAKRRKKK